MFWAVVPAAGYARRVARPDALIVPVPHRLADERLPDPRRVDPDRRQAVRLVAFTAAGLLVAGGGWFGGVLPARAHHGYLGRHDFARPWYLAGTVTQAYVGEPHARLTVRVPDGLRLPRDTEHMRAIEDAELRSTLSMLVRSPQRGTQTLVLDASTTRVLIDQPQRLRIGDRIEAIVYQRTSSDEYRHELRVALLVQGDGRVLVASSPGVSSGAGSAASSSATR